MTVFNKAMTWLRARLENKWMNDVTYLATMAHVGWAALIMVAVSSCAGYTSSAMKWTAIGLLIFAFIKEFGYDAAFEIPKQRFSSNLTDFLGYAGGTALGWGLVRLALHLQPHLR